MACSRPRMWSSWREHNQIAAAILLSESLAKRNPDRPDKLERQRALADAVAIIVRSKKAEIPFKSAEIAVLKLAAIVRRADRQRSLGYTRAELRAFLQETERLSTGLASKLHDTVLAKALRQAVVSQADAASWEATGVALDGLAKTKRYLTSLSSALRHAVPAGHRRVHA
jgi:hypothetical protein